VSYILRVQKQLKQLTIHFNQFHLECLRYARQEESDDVERDAQKEVENAQQLPNQVRQDQVRISSTYTNQQKNDHKRQQNETTSSENVRWLTIKINHSNA